MNSAQIRNAIFKILFYTGLGHILHFRNKRSGKIPILLFHRISPEPDPCWPPLHPDAFEHTIRLLSRHYAFCSLDELIGGNAGKNACCIAFDDGYLDFKEHAFPVLLKYKIPVTLFVPTNNIENNLPLWTNEADSFVRNLKKENENSSISIGNETVSLKLSSSKDLFRTATQVKDRLMSIEPGTRDKIISDLQNKYGQKRSDLKMLSWNDISDMQAKAPGLLNIQSHTHTHPFLPSLKPDRLEAEMENSRNHLEKKNLNKINAIAYPIGACNDNTLVFARKHYAHAFMVGEKLVELSQLQNNPEYLYRIPRFNISDNTGYEIFFRVNEFHRIFS
ncbi:MAG: polysaccharide deacetylase family protein [Bacteroidetes bacterium]|nr:MAG: polysaccharide deacetylase family protein [Bacteroidota bacterium]